MQYLIHMLIVAFMLTLTTCGAYAYSSSPQCDALYGGIGDTESEYTLCQDYAIGYDADRKMALWAAYSVTDTNALHIVKRGHYFRSDHRLSRKDRTYASWYTRSGYDRGHLAPANIFRYSRKAERASFLMSNVVPQLPGINRGVWRMLELRVLKSVKTMGNAIVIAGPIFKNGNKVIARELKVPDAFYKIIIRKSPLRSLAFIIPNSKIPKGYSLTDYVVSIDSIESLVNLDFLNSYSLKVQRGVESNLADINAWPIILKH